MAGAQSRRDRVRPDDGHARALTESIKRIAQRRQKVADELEAVDREYAETLLKAYRDGLSWAEVAKAAGLRTGNQARMRAERAMSDAEIAPSRRRAGAPASRPAPPGISVAEAAERLGVAQSTVYERVDRGEINATTDALGRTRILFDDEV